MSQKSLINFFGRSALLFLIASFAGSLWAQVDLGTLTTAPNPASDESMKVFTSIFGSFAQNPFSQLGGPTTLLGGLFLIFNSCLFTLGFAWALYRIVSGIAATANEGEVLGKNMSTVWFPIRMTVGISGLIPVFGGFTLSQAIMMFLTIIGINIGNQMVSGAIADTANFKAMVAIDGFSPASTNQLRDAARTMFVGNVCLLSEKTEKEKAMAAGAKYGAGEIPQELRPPSGYAIQYGTPNYVNQCGQVSLAGIGGGGARDRSTMLSFRVDSVDYNAIGSAAISAYGTSINQLNIRIARLAGEWYRAKEAAVLSNAETPPVPLLAVEQLIAQASREINANIAASINGQGITQAAQNNMRALGWFGIGAWYSTFAEANAAIADAAKGPVVSSEMPTFNGVTDKTNDVIIASLLRGWDKARESVEQNTSKSGAQALLDSAIQDNCSSIGAINSVVGTATGNCSLGQGIVSAAIRASAIGSGGGGNGAGSLSFDSTGLVNPIIMMKNMGDYVMTFSSTVLLSGGIVDIASRIMPNSWVVSAAKGVANFAGGAISNVAKAAGMEGLGGGASSWIQTIAFYSLVLGAMMAIYIPLVPFIHWMGAIIAYVASMIEGIAGATLHSMAHIDGDGDGMGQRTSHGYLFWINAIARPPLMIIGFFVASAVMIAIGTLQAKLFLPAMAGVQGNSITGLFSIVALLLVFFVMNWTLISACFNLIYVITDQVIGFLGNAINSHLGKDTEDKANNMFLMAARVGPSAINSNEQRKSGMDKANLAKNSTGGSGSKNRTDPNAN